MRGVKGAISVCVCVCVCVCAYCYFIYCYFIYMRYGLGPGLSDPQPIVCYDY